MSRAGNLIGTFETVDYSTAKDGQRPWTAEDRARLAGKFAIGGRLTKPHVDTPAGPYIIGAVNLWCMRTIGQRADRTPIICANRKSRAIDKFCKSCSAACAGAT